MNVAVNAAQKPKVGTCPHGLPLGACPICSGMGGGGGGGGSAKKANPHAGEMSWDQCYAIWQQMQKAQQLALQKKNDALQAQMQPPVNFTAKFANAAQGISNLAQKLADFVQKTQSQTQTLPKIISKPLVLAAKIAIPLLNVLKEIPLLAQKTINFVSQKLADISDKLNAIFGELKNSIEKKVSDNLKNIKKKFKSLFEIFTEQEIKEEKVKETEDFITDFSPNHSFTHSFEGEKIENADS